MLARPWWQNRKLIKNSSPDYAAQWSPNKVPNCLLIIEHDTDELSLSSDSQNSPYPYRSDQETSEGESDTAFDGAPNFLGMILDAEHDAEMSQLPGGDFPRNAAGYSDHIDSEENNEPEPDSTRTELTKRKAHSSEEDLTEDGNDTRSAAQKAAKPPTKRRRGPLERKIVFPRDKSQGTKFLSARFKPIKKQIKLIEDSIEGGATCFFYCRPRYGDARQLLSSNIPVIPLNNSMKHKVFVNFLDNLSKVSHTGRNLPIPEDLDWNSFRDLMLQVDMACLKKVIRRIAHLVDGRVVTYHRFVFSKYGYCSQLV